jgi:flagellar biosynthetic protein FliP
MNSKFKKRYCAASVIFAIAVVLLTIFSVVSGKKTVYAADADTIFDMPDPEDITGFADQDNPVSDAQADAADSTTNGFSITYNNESGSLSTPVKMLIVLTVLSLAPSLMIMLTSFTKIIIVLHFVRTAIGTQTSPPNQVMIGLALFLTFFIMWPTFQEVNTNAIQPLDAGTITQEEAIEAAEEPFREFMSGQTRTKELDLFIDISGETYESYDEVPFTTLVPAFILSQLREAFIMGFLIYIPFIVIDMVVASVLMSMGMMMLPPTTISLPFKILLFILADGWDLVIGSLVKTFY